MIGEMRMRYLLRLLVAGDGIFSDPHLIRCLDLGQLCDSEIDNRKEDSAHQRQSEDQWCREEL